MAIVTGDTIVAADVLDLGAYLVVADMQVIPATGTFSGTPEGINDNNVATNAIADTIDQYAQILLLSVVRITQYRHYGDVAMNADGVWKIQYRPPDASAWVDWVTGIAVRATADWSAWDNSGGEITAIALRLVATTIDTGGGGVSVLRELEVKY